jgi:hypothetical protein
VKRILQKISALVVVILLFQLVVHGSGLLTTSHFSKASSTVGQIKVNFQPAVQAVPTGYYQDEGLPFADRGNELHYGWNLDHTEATVSRDVYSLDPGDTHIAIQEGGVWEIELPNGDYDLSISLGGAAQASTNTLRVEGIMAADSLLLEAGQLAVLTESVAVADGRLTVDAGLMETAKINWIVITPAEGLLIGQGIGLKAEYFHEINLTGLGTVRLDETINFDWENNSPTAEVDADDFSVRWSGKVEPLYSEEYTIRTEAHGGIRLWVNDTLLIDDWDTNGHRSNQATVNMEAGELYDLQIEYLEDQGAARAKLEWSSASQALQVIPKTQLYPPYIPGVPATIETETTSSAVQITWGAVEGALGYEIEAEGAIVYSGSATSFTHTPLSPNTVYTYRVRATAEGIDGNWSEAVSGLTNVAVPLNLEFSYGTDSITVQWDTVPGADTYEIEVDGDLTTLGTEPTFVHEGVIPGTEHIYRVRALREGVSGDWTESVTKALAAQIPGNVTAVPSSNAIALTWDPVIDAVGYDIEADGHLISLAPLTAYLHNNLESNTLHSYKIRARKTDGTGEWSPIVSVSTLPAPGGGTGLKAEYFDSTELTHSQHIRIDDTVYFHWNQNSPSPGLPGDEYSVRWTGQVEPKFSQLYTFTSEAHGGIRLWVNHQLLVDDWDAHHDALNQGNILLEAGQRYDIQLEYRETNGTARVELRWQSAGQPSEVIPQTQLYPIGVPQMSAIAEETAITLAWGAVSNTQQYEVEVDGASIGWLMATTYTHSNLIPGTRHTYRVRAGDGDIVGEWSATTTAVTPLGETIVTEMTPTEYDMLVRWTAVDGAASYDLELDGSVLNVGNITEYLHTDLAPGTYHTYRVRPKTNVYIGSWTALESKWTLPDIPQHVVAAATSESITLVWDDVVGAVSYEVETNNSVLDIGAGPIYTDVGLTPNTQRTYWIRAKNSSGLGKWTPIIAKATLPGVPASLEAEVTSDSVTVTWSPTAGADAYELEIDGDSIIENLTGTSYEHTALLPVSTHTYRVRAKNEDGISDWSAVMEATTLPSVPVGLHGVAGPDAITIMWESVPEAAGYEIEVDGAVIDMGQIIRYEHLQLDSNTEHTYRVRAIHGALVSEWSEIISVRTSPGVPANLRTVAISSSLVQFSWDVVVGAEGYQVEQDGTVVDHGLSTSYVHTELGSHTRHVYRVRAVIQGTAGPWTPSLEARTLFAPPLNIVTESGTGTVSIDWDAVTGASAYDIMVDGVTIDAGTETSFQHLLLEPFSYHFYRVRAKDSDTTGEWSEAITGITRLGIPSGVDGKGFEGHIELMWDEVEGAAYYTVEVGGETLATVQEPSYTLESLSANTAYPIRIQAGNAVIQSEWSPVHSLWTSPPVPQQLAAVPANESISLSWQAANSHGRYDLEIDGMLITDMAEPKYVHANLKPNTMHVYRVRSAGPNGVSAWSEPIKATTTPLIKVQVGKDTLFNFLFVAPEQGGVSQRRVTVEYEADELEVVDLSVVTPKYEVSAGRIEGTSITVLSFSPGKIVYLIEDAADRAVVNSIRFLAKTGQYSGISYTIE